MKDLTERISEIEIRTDQQERILRLFRELALELVMELPHKDGCALYKGEQSDSCDCTDIDTITRLIQRIEEDTE